MDLKESLTLKGWDMRPPGYVPFDLSAASAEFEHVYAKGVTESGYENVASLRADEVANLPVLAGILRGVKRYMQSISPALRFEKLWLVKSKPENVHSDVVPFIPHIDKRRYVKAMIYLDNVTDGDGPFTVTSQAPENYETLRRTFGPDYKELRQNVIDTIPIADYSKCTGPAGTVIFFDTSCPHFAGQVRGAGQRRVLRFDFTNPAWNERSLFSRIFVTARGTASQDPIASRKTPLRDGGR